MVTLKAEAEGEGAAEAEEGGKSSGLMNPVVLSNRSRLCVLGG